ncbi:hypothetical protein KY285_008908 [Solanum tuberosum]|nr:hypothetical protein KY285_008908 [Solanum tuberosum]
MKDIREMMNDEGWDSGKLQQALLEKIIDHVQEHLRNFIPSSLSDKQCWLLNSTETFKVKTAWEWLREKQEEHPQYAMPSPETVQHLFLTGEIAREKWRNASGNEKFKTIMKAIPIIILWPL